jgi:hypothetical protein
MKVFCLQNECEIISHNINWFKAEKEVKNKNVKQISVF